MSLFLSSLRSIHFRVLSQLKYNEENHITLRAHTDLQCLIRAQEAALPDNFVGHNGPFHIGFPMSSYWGPPSSLIRTHNSLQLSIISNVLGR